MNRRHFLQLAGAACVTPLLARRLSAETAASHPASLGAEAAARGLRYGSTPELNMTPEPQAYRDLFREQARLLVPGYFSWSWVAPTPTTYDFIKEQANVDYAAEWKMPLSGSHLIWQRRVPEWFKTITDAGQAEKAMLHHIAEMTSRFHGRFFSWNAVNESIGPQEGRADGLRAKDAFMQILGPRYIDVAFHAARAGEPMAFLAFNDYGYEADTPVAEARRRTLLKLLDGLLDRKVPIDAVGLQSHLSLSEPFDQKVYRSFLHEVSARGLKILITELDVNDQTGPADVAARDQLVADRYAQFLDVALDEKRVVELVTWGLSNRYTWLNPGYDARFGRADKLPCRPLPFDHDFQPTPVYHALLNSIRHCPERPLTAARLA